MAKVIMIQGSMSNVGKSLLCAAFCRIFTQDGYKVAPFKSQNMALNSFVTKDNLEIGRAQAVQAFACKKEPTVDIVDIEEEDSQSERFKKYEVLYDINTIELNGKIKVGIIKLPRMSNYTDFAPLEKNKNLIVSYITSNSDILNQDIIIIPGTKNTIADLQWMKENSIATAIIKAKNNGKIVIGICGGYQILGEEIVDEVGAESEKNACGLGLLKIKTRFNTNKITINSSGNIVFDKALSDKKVSGYEIHMGISEYLDDFFADATPFAKLDDGRLDGAVCKNVYGTYLHGIFENKLFTHYILKQALRNKGFENSEIDKYNLDEMLDYNTYREKQYDQLAQQVRNNIDMGMIYEILEIR